jgi:signal transduction histidine kinase
MPGTRSHPARPSTWWIVAAVATFSSAVVLLGVSVATQRAADRPVGEGELFAEEASGASAVIAQSSNAPDDTVRRIRNDLEVEAVSIVDPSGTIEVSTSPTLLGSAIDSPVLAYANATRLFAAAAVSQTTPIVIDTVEAWKRGSTLYEVLEPLPDGSSLLIHYDISELLSRRSTSGGLTTRSLTTGTIAATLLLVTFALIVGRMRANTRFEALARESDLLEVHNAELEDRNLRLDDARRAAESALELAEEKNRIRAEFVLMINHELRTPLTSVITGARVLAEELAHGPETEIVDAMVRDGDRLEQMIDQILAVARIENRGLASVVTDLDAPTVWREVSANLPPSVPTAVRCDLDIERLATDATTLGQLVRSLVDNAFTHGAAAVSVTIGDQAPISPDTSTGALVRDGLFIDVIDDGPGIDPDFLPRVFEKFEKHGFSSGTGL